VRTQASSSKTAESVAENRAVLAAAASDASDARDTSDAATSRSTALIVNDRYVEKTAETSGGRRARCDIAGERDHRSAPAAAQNTYNRRKFFFFS
jgi:hypothetical protein